MVSPLSSNATDETHISSLVVQVKPALMPDITRRIRALAQVELPITDPKGKLVVCLETATLQQVTNSIDVITTLPGVLGCTLVSHHVEATAALDELMDTPEADRTETTA